MMNPITVLLLNKNEDTKTFQKMTADSNPHTPPLPSSLLLHSAESRWLTLPLLNLLFFFLPVFPLCLRVRLVCVRNAILREIDVAHPAAKSMIELSRTQDEEVGDGTTSVIILSGELLSVAQPFLDRNMHPRHIVGAYVKSLDESLAVLDRMCVKLDVTDRDAMMSLVRSCIGTKFVSRFGDLVANLAIEAVLKVTIDKGAAGGKEIDIKRYARVEKVPGGMLEESHVLNGVMLNKDVVHPGMRRRIVNPRILLMDCPLEYKKAESQTNLELNKESDFEAVLRQEEEFIKNLCDAIIKHKPDIVCTEKGVADLTQHYLAKAGISVLRRLRKTDNNRIARATGATICNVPEEIREEDIGTRCGLFEVRKISDEYFAFMEECTEPKACTILLRGASKDVLNEVGGTARHWHTRGHGLKHTHTHTHTYTHTHTHHPAPRSEQGRPQ